MRALLSVTLAIAALGAFPAAAYESFQSPSGNIGCGYFEEGILRCDILEISNELPRRPADCELEWGQAFEMAEGDRNAAPICYGDTVVDPDSPVLDYGRSWEGGGFSCLSSERGINCRNAEGAGWDLSRRSQRVY